MLNQLHFQKRISAQPRNVDEFAFLGDELAHKVVIDNPNQLAATLNRLVVKGDLYTPFIDKSEEKVAEMTYAKAFEIYGNPLPDIADRRIERELSSILGNGFARDLSGFANVGTAFK